MVHKVVVAEAVKRLAYPPAEFARLHGRHPSWAYRQLYQGKLKAITSLGRILIPAEECDRVMSSAAIYNPKPRPTKGNIVGGEAVA